MKLTSATAQITTFNNILIPWKTKTSTQLNGSPQYCTKERQNWSVQIPVQMHSNTKLNQPSHIKWPASLHHATKLIHHLPPTLAHRTKTHTQEEEPSNNPTPQLTWWLSPHTEHHLDRKPNSARCSKFIFSQMQTITNG